MRKTIQSIVIIAVIVILLVSCLPNGYDTAVVTTTEAAPEKAESPAGFFMGIWHGWLAPISLIVSLFRDTVRIYEVDNIGWWYDFGYYIAIISGFGGISLVRKKKREDHYKD